MLGQLMRLPVFATFQGGDKTQSFLEASVQHLSLMSLLTVGWLNAAELVNRIFRKLQN
jgi:hypothetical protein